ARLALAQCHYDPDTLEDRGGAPQARERCEAACYDCLLSYYNQRDHGVLDRASIRDLLTAWRFGEVVIDPRPPVRSPGPDGGPRPPEVRDPAASAVEGPLAAW